MRGGGGGKERDYSRVTHTNHKPIFPSTSTSLMHTDSFECVDGAGCKTVSCKTSYDLGSGISVGWASSRPTAAAGNTLQGCLRKRRKKKNRNPPLQVNWLQIVYGETPAQRGLLRAGWLEPLQSRNRTEVSVDVSCEQSCLCNGQNTVETTVTSCWERSR